MGNKDWKELPIKAAAIKLTSGGTPPTKNSAYYENGNIPWLNTKEIDFNRITQTEKYITEEGLKNSSAKWIDKNSVIVAMYGATAAKVAISKIPLTTNQACCNIIVNDEICDYEFLFYNISNKYLELENIAVGAAQQNLSVGVIGNFILKFPPLPEQKAIASVLSSLDDKIELLHQQNQTLEALAETFFRQWFIEEAKEDWEEGKLGDLIDIFGGYSYKGNRIGHGSSYLLGMGCVSYNNRFLNSGMRKYDEEVNNKYLVEKGDIVIATRQQSDNLPILGAPALIPEIDENYKVIVGTNLYKVVNKSNVHYYSLYTLLRSKEYKNFIKSNAKGSTVRMITKDAILSFPILLPPINIVNNLNEELNSINNKIELNINQLQTLTKLRDTLIPKLMSGEVRVKIDSP